MPFEYNLYENHTLFHNIPMNETFRLNKRKHTRFIDGTTSTKPALGIELNSTGFTAGYALATYLESKQSFFLEELFVEEAFRLRYLGSLLVYIITMEIRLNGGGYLYAMDAGSQSPGFLSQIGFYPAPEVASSFDRMYDIVDTPQRNHFIHLLNIKHFML